MSDTTINSTNTKSIRHQKILDVAADDPEASLQEIADEVPSATANLVERVLDKYGDPADGDPDPTNDSKPVTDAEQEEDAVKTTAYPDFESLSAKEQETLQAIHEQPEATQRELAEMLGVSAATISNRVNGITGFDWNTRDAFTDAVIDETGPTTDALRTGEPTTTAMTDGATNTAKEPTPIETDTDADEHDHASETVETPERATVEQLSDRLTSIEEQLETIEDNDDRQSAFSDPELAHKMLHACLESEVISEDEELRILRTLLG